MKKKLICMVLGLGMGLSSFAAVSNTPECRSILTACLVNGGTLDECRAVHAACMNGDRG